MSQTATRNLVFCFPCPACGEPISLPSQSALGAFGTSQYLCASVWPIHFLCSRYFQIFAVPQSLIRTSTEAQVSRISRSSSLWQIECECSVESCGRPHSIYTSYEKDANPILVSRMILTNKPVVACTGGHSLKFHREHLTAFRLVGG